MKIFPVIHYKDDETTFQNLKIIFENTPSADGVFIILMNGLFCSTNATDETIISVAKIIKKMYPNKLIGVNSLSKSPLESLNQNLNAGLDMTWADKTILTSFKISKEAEKISKILKNKDHKFFTSVAFKYQESCNDPGMAACLAVSMGFIPTTSGEGTGIAADLEKIIDIHDDLIHEDLNFVEEINGLALASGLSPDNIKIYKPYIDYAIVSTGISKNFYEFDKNLFNNFMEIISNE